MHLHTDASAAAHVARVEYVGRSDIAAAAQGFTIIQIPSVRPKHTAAFVKNAKRDVKPIRMIVRVWY